MATPTLNVGLFKLWSTRPTENEKIVTYLFIIMTNMSKDDTATMWYKALILLKNIDIGPSKLYTSWLTL